VVRKAVEPWCLEYEQVATCYLKLNRAYELSSGPVLSKLQSKKKPSDWLHSTVPFSKEVVWPLM
jgi:hypothetical protein